MTPLRHLVEPTRLLLTWQPADEGASARTRRVVAEVVPTAQGKGAVFRYLFNTSDFAQARAAGFQGFPAFNLDVPQTDEGVLDALVRRLPPRKREDFENFLRPHSLPYPFPLSDIALLGYTGAKLPSDGFALVPEFDATNLPCDSVMEVAGTRYASPDLSRLQVGDAITVAHDSSNPVDTDALAVYHGTQTIGYVNRAMRATFQGWMAKGDITMAVARKNGKPHRPLVYVRVSVVQRAAHPAEAA